MKDTPETQAEAQRRKSGMPRIAIFLVLGLAAVWLLFWGPALFDSATDERVGGVEMMLEPGAAQQPAQGR